MHRPYPWGDFLALVQKVRCAQKHASLVRTFLSGHHRLVLCDYEHELDAACARLSARLDWDRADAAFEIESAAPREAAEAFAVVEGEG
jgi:hypothetical protein